nr:hypothetical protein [Methylobacterium sp. L1A1]
MKSTLVGIAALLLLPSVVHAADPFKRLTGAQIKARVSGLELSDGVHWSHVLGRDGRLATTSMGKTSVGKWRVEGDTLCLTESAGKPTCSEVWAAGPRVQLRREGALPEDVDVQKPVQRN